MATATHVPIEVYLCSSYEPDAEYVDGQIEGRPEGENDHSAWLEAICFWFRQHAQDWNVKSSLAISQKTTAVVNRS
jgi:hypothetical protein